MRFASILLAFLVSPAFAQLEAISKKASAIVDSVTTTQTVDTSQLRTVDGDPIGEAVTTERPAITVSTRAEKAAAVVFLQTERPIGELLIRIKSKTCKPVLIEPGVYSVTEPGKHEVSVTAIGQNPLSWDDVDIIVEVAGIPPNPEPDPNPNPNPPGPDNGAFNGLASRVNVLAVQLSQAARNQIAGVFLTSADKLQTFEWKQTKQAKDYILKNWPPCETPACGALYKLIADDAKTRLLSWQETQDYYRTVAAGVLK